MDYHKILGLAALSIALMTLGGTATATIVTSPAGTISTSTVTATSTHSSFHGSFVSSTCTHSSLKFKVEMHGAAATAEGKLTEWTFGGCNYLLTVRKPGALEFHATGGGNGTLTSSGAELVLHTSVGECVLTTAGTHIGTFTGGSPAVLDVGSAALPRTGGSFFCGSAWTWTGGYTFTTPSSLLLD
jgi:hypothetical protein